MKALLPPKVALPIKIAFAKVESPEIVAFSPVKVTVLPLAESPLPEVLLFVQSPETVMSFWSERIAEDAISILFRTESESEYEMELAAELNRIVSEEAIFSAESVSSTSVPDKSEVPFNSTALNLAFSFDLKL